MEKSVEEYSPLVLAYIGDGAYELFIRTLIVLRGNRQVSKMHTESANLVKASTQARIIKAIKDDLTDIEKSIFRRGRNANSHTMAKNASMSDYRHATGFEALMGYLYLKGEYERAIELMRMGLERIIPSDA